MLEREALRETVVRSDPGVTQSHAGGEKGEEEEKEAAYNPTK